MRLILKQRFIGLQNLARYRIFLRLRLRPLQIDTGNPRPVRRGQKLRDDITRFD